MKKERHGHTKHNGKRSTEYISWYCMKRRCCYPLDKHYKDYGGRGISVCKEWEHSFITFLKDMGYKPEGYSLDRIDNDGNYCKENCKWESKLKQQGKKRNSHMVTYLGETAHIAHFIRKFGLKHSTVFNRLKVGLPLDMVFSKKNFKTTGYC